MIRKIYRHNGYFGLECGKALHKPEICYHVSAETPGSRKVVWICHALTANSDPSEWWGELVGSGKYFDTDKYFVVCANMIGSCYGTTGPASVDPETGNPYLLSFPLLSVRDLVSAHELLRQHLGIEKIDLLIGGSSGGFQAVEWAVSAPWLVRNLCLLATNARISPWGTAFNESQRMALMTDPGFTAQASPDAGTKGLECARGIALLSYRSYECYGLTQSEDSDCLLAERASSYQKYQGAKLAGRFNAYSYYCLTRMLDTHNVGRGRGGLAKALGKIESNTICIAVDSDVLFPREEMKILAGMIPGAVLEVIGSPYGHDGFLLEHEKIINALNQNLTL